MQQFNGPKLIHGIKSISYVSKYPTKLQNGHFRIFPSFRFYVKSIFGLLKIWKIVVFAILGPGSEFCYLGKFQQSKCAKISWILKFRSSKYVKMADFTLLQSPKLISRANVGHFLKYFLVLPHGKFGIYLQRPKWG